MNRKIALFLALLMPASLSLAKSIPASPPSYIYNDGVLSAGGEAAVSRALSAFEKKTKHQMIVAAFKSLDGDNLESYSNKLFKAWKIGDKKKNDGILFAMFLADRKWRVEVGYGFEGKLTDIQAYNIATTAAVPSFKKGDYDSGVEAVISSLQNELSRDEKVSDRSTGSVVASSPVPVKNAPIKNDFPYGYLIIVIIVVVVLFLIVAISDGGFGGFGGGSGNSSSGDFGGGDGGSGGFSGGGGSSGGGGASGGW